MSACISKHGEFGEHLPGDEFTCTRCYVLDEDALRAEVEAVAASLSERDRALTACNNDLNRALGLLRTAEAEVGRLENNLSDLLCDLTGGRLSKTTYDVPTMAQAIEDYFAEDVAEAEAERNLLREAVGRVKALLDKEDARVAGVNERLERRELETKTGSPYRVVGIVTTREIRAILDATP
jgi:hypothetical protein